MTDVLLCKRQLQERAALTTTINVLLHATDHAGSLCSREIHVFITVTQHCLAVTVSKSSCLVDK